ncbi:MAG: hypothetical protein Q9168_006272 [Polycauliona sp. 1 TL-2023]
MDPPKFYACIDYEDTYTHKIILDAFSSLHPFQEYRMISTINDLPSTESPFLHISSYESLHFQHLQDHPRTTLANSYVIRKALIRKHYLAHTVRSYLVKYTDSALRDHVPVTVDFEVDYAEFLDEALVEAYELNESFVRNEGKDAVDREWWILKPSMSDRGVGIRLFSTEQELHDIFDQWESDQPESEDEANVAHHSDDDDEQIQQGVLDIKPSRPPNFDSGIITSQLRHFIAQPYIPPLLLPEYQNRKFHIRTYTLSVGAIRVYVYKHMLALFAEIPYRALGSSSDDSDAEDSMDMRSHLTNTCLQPTSSSTTPTVLPLHSLTSSLLPPPLLESITKQIYTTTSTLFRAAIAQPTNFQPLPNAFEVFGVDWLVGIDGKVYLLEVNAFPDFKQSGNEEGRGVVEGLWRGVLGVLLREDGGFFGGERDMGNKAVGKDWGMEEVLRVDMGRR